MCRGFLSKTNEEWKQKPNSVSVSNKSSSQENSPNCLLGTLNVTPGNAALFVAINIHSFKQQLHVSKMLEAYVNTDSPGANYIIRN